MPINQFEQTLSGGHPNSLGNTEQVVKEILRDKNKLQDLYDCYGSKDEVVRLRVSSAMKRVCKAHPDWVAEYLDRLIKDISTIDQPSTKWTLAILFVLLNKHMSLEQRTEAIEVMKTNLLTENDWIVQNTTAESLAYFAKRDNALMKWLIPELEKMHHDSRKSISKRADKLLKVLD